MSSDLAQPSPWTRGHTEYILVAMLISAERLQGIFITSGTSVLDWGMFVTEDTQTVELVYPSALSSHQLSLWLAAAFSAVIGRFVLNLTGTEVSI